MSWLLYIYAYFFSDFLHFDMSLLLLTVTLQGVSNKHCLLPLFSLSVTSEGMSTEYWLTTKVTPVKKVWLGLLTVPTLPQLFNIDVKQDVKQTNCTIKMLEKCKSESE